MYMSGLAVAGAELGRADEQRELRARAQGQLLERVPDRSLDVQDRDAEPLGDLGVRAAFRHEADGARLREGQAAQSRFHGADDVPGR